MGRFLSPDPSGIFLGNLGDPQQLNLYAYVRNNPINNTDPTGLKCDTPQAGGANSDEEGSVDLSNFDNDQLGCAASGGQWVDPLPSTNITVTAPWPDEDWSGLPGALTGAPTGGLFSQQGPQSVGSLFNPQPQGSRGTPWYNTCGAKAAANFALHGGVDAIGLFPGIGDLSEAAVGAIGFTAGYGVAAMDLATPEGIGNGGAAMLGGGTALFVADASKASIAAVTRVAAAAKFIPFANKAFAAVSVGYDAVKAYQAYQTCKVGGG